MPVRAFYHAEIAKFAQESNEQILGKLVLENPFPLEEQQRDAWLQQVTILKAALVGVPYGRIFLEFYIPRMGKRVDALLITHNIVFILEFKVCATEYASHALEQVEDYALDLKNFHQGSHDAPIVPVLVATHARDAGEQHLSFARDSVAAPLKANRTDLAFLITRVCSICSFPPFDVSLWMPSGYRPTPTIVQAAEMLYRTHSVSDIANAESGRQNLEQTSTSVSEIIDSSRHYSQKSICFVTGVPGSGKTLAGLNFATRRSDVHPDEHAVFLSGNGPLVAVLREALARDKTQREHIPKSRALREVSSFVQNIHHFRDEYLKNDATPLEKVVVFDEAQRAWSSEKTASFMKQKKGILNFNLSEPAFLISVMDRHTDWCCVVCLVGGGQEINAGEAGISEWLRAIEDRFPVWRVYLSPRFDLPPYVSPQEPIRILASPRAHVDERLHLDVSIRSFRAEALSEFVAHVVNSEEEEAAAIYTNLLKEYPIYLTRDISLARRWLRDKARGSERFGLIASSGALRLRAEGLHVKAGIEPADWFLNDRADVRSSFYLEELATEFDIQGLELDWVGVCWDADLRHNGERWLHHSFRGSRWQFVKQKSKKLYRTNAYRVLLTRARQGMVIFIPRGDATDASRLPSFYDPTYDFLRGCGISDLQS